MRFKIEKLNIEMLTAQYNKPRPLKNIVVSSDFAPVLDYKQKRISFYSIVYCKGGLYNLNIGSENYEICAGELIFFKPTDVYEIINFEAFDGYMIAFSVDFLNANIKVISQPFFENNAHSVLQVPQTQQDLICHYFELIEAKEKQVYPSFLRDEIIRGLLTALLYEVTNLYIDTPVAEIHTMESSSRTDLIFIKFKFYLNNEFQQERTVSYYADKLSISSNYLTQIVAERTGSTALDIIHQKVIKELKVCLKTTSYPISDIASTFNFPDSSTFIKFFKRKVQLTPHKYRIMKS